MSDASEGLLSAGLITPVLPPPNLVIRNPISDFSSETEAALALRYGRLKRKQEELSFEYTRDTALLHQYFELYKRECRMIPEFAAFEDECNQRAHILIVRKGNMVVGGARILSKTPRQPKPFFLELAGFSLNKHFPDLDQKQLSCGELSRLVLLPEFRTGDITKQMFYHLYRKSVALGFSYGFAAAPRPNVRAYRRHFAAIGLTKTKIHYDIDIPPDPGFDEVKDYLFSLIIDQSLLPAMEKIIESEKFASELESV